IVMQEMFVILAAGRSLGPCVGKQGIMVFRPRGDQSRMPPVTARAVSWLDPIQRSCLVFLLLLSPSLTRAVEKPASDQAQGIAFFESKIRPVLVEHCYKCHSAAAA